MKPCRRPLTALLILVLALITVACGAELTGGISAEVTDSGSMVAGETSGGSDGATSMAVMQGSPYLSNNALVDGVQLESVIDVLGGSIQQAVNTAHDGDKIIVFPGLYKENVNVPKSLIIEGSGAHWTIVDGQQKGPVFSIDQDKTVTLSGMTIQNGHGSSRYSQPQGGGIMNGGITTIENCIIKNNYAEDSGGGIFNYYDPTANPTSSLIVENSQFIGNSAFRNGGAIFNSGPLKISNCFFDKNTAALDPSADALGGGAIANPLGQLAVSNSIFIDNIANSGGAIFNADSGTADINHCTFAGNKAIGNWAPSSGLGGAIFNGHDPGSCTIKNSIITSNSAKINGGGIYWGGTAPTITRSILFGNTPNNIGHA